MNRNEPLADVRDMYMVHTMMRREFTLLPDAVRRVAAGDRRRAEVVGAHVQLLSRIVHLHHEGEDLLLWPLLHERGGAEAEAIVPTMQAQHHAIEEAAKAVDRLLPVWRSTGRDGAALADALTRLQEVLVEHMALEERELLPLAERYITAPEWRKLGEHSLNETPKKDLPLEFGMASYEGDAEVIRGVLQEVPQPMRLLVPIIGRRAYAKQAREVYGTANPPRVGAVATRR